MVGVRSILPVLLLLHCLLSSDALFKERTDKDILARLQEVRSQEDSTRVFFLERELDGGPDPTCWGDRRFNFRKCCNAVNYNIDTSSCWDEGFTRNRCCGDKVFFPSTCVEYVQHFEFDYMKCAICDSDVARKTLMDCLEFLRKDGGYIEPGKEVLSVAGVHYPTVTIQHTDLRKFSFPALDGYVGNNFLSVGQWMPVEVDLLKFFLREGDIVVDAGANIGGFAVPLARTVGRTGMVHAFEPFRVLFQHLTANVALNGLLNVITHHNGLGATSATITRPMPDMNVVSNPSKSHIPEEVANTMLVYHEAGFTEEVEVRPLDSWIDKFSKKVTMIKIDVESMELDMLKGASKILQYHRPLLFVEDSTEKESTSLDMTQRPHLRKYSEDADFRPEIEESTQVTRFLFGYGYLCIDLYKYVGGQLTSLFCAPDEHFGTFLTGVRAYFRQMATPLIDAAP